MTCSTEYERTLDLITQSENILLTTHTRPDGDACGSMTAMADALTAIGKKVKMLMLSQVPEWYEFLFSEKVPVLDEDVSIEQLENGRFDLIVILDTNSYSQLPKFNDFLKANTKPVLAIDHHVTSDNLGEVELVDATAAATGLIVLDFLKFAKWTVTSKIAEALFVAVATDTGWFRFSNTDSRALQNCAELIELGTNPSMVYNKLYQSFSVQRFKLMTVMLNSLELHLDGRYAAQYLLQSDFKNTGAAYNDTEDLINECQRISSVEAVAMFVELSDGRIKCSLRSKGSVNVCEIAQKFGGGGHTLAAGTHLPGPLGNAKKLIEDEIEKQL